MPQVDPDDDTTRRIVLRHYRYDRDLLERRHIDVVAFDYEWGLLQEYGRRHYELVDRKREGTADPWEQFTGISKVPRDEAGRQASKRAKWLCRGQAASHAGQQRDQLRE